MRHDAGSLLARLFDPLISGKQVTPRNIAQAILRSKTSYLCLLDSYGSCRSLPWHLIGVGVPALVGLLGAVLVAASPQCPGVAVRLVAPGLGDDGPPKLSQQLRNGDGDEAECGGAAVAGALAGGGHGKEGIGEQADRGPAVP